MSINIKNIVLDTDIGTDSDDIGALAILCALDRRKLINLKAVTSCSSTIEPIKTIDIISNFYNRNFPIGRSETEYGNDEEHGQYARVLAKEYPSRIDSDSVESAVRVLRKVLVNNQISLVTIGPMHNIMDFLKTKSDDISDLTGMELSKNIKELYSMAGTFTEHFAEWNTNENIKSVQYVLKKLACPITFVPYEVGIKVLTGASFLEGIDSPMKRGYYVHNKGPRESWDPITAYLCVFDDEDISYSPYGQIKVDDKGLSTFTIANKKHRYVKDDFDSEKLRLKIEKLMGV